MHFKSTLFLFLFVAYPFFMVGQSVNLSTQNARAIKYYNKALEEIRARDFNEAIFLYKKAIRSDRYFSEAYMRLGSTYTMLMETDSAYHYYDRYRKITPGDAIPAPMVLLLSRLYFERGEYAVADSTLSLLEENDWRNEPQDNLLRESIVFSRAHQGEASDLDIEVLPQAVNKFYTQYFPAVTIDNRTLFFTARQGLGLYDDEDLYQSVNIDGIWQEAQLVSRSVSSRSNEGACTISADGRTLIFTSCEEGRTFGSCDLYISMREGDVWAKPKNMGKAVNSKYWDSQPSLSADGTTLYFSSNRPGGLGQRDVWVSYLNGEEWSVPVNLGAPVNTLFDEVTPYIHVNNQALFFSSNGHPGFGRYDLFLSERQDSSWAQPKNLGYPVNNHLDQLSMIISSDGKTGYFAQEEANEKGDKVSKIARVRFESDTLLSDRSSYVTGTIRDISDQKPLKASISLYDLTNGARKYLTQSDPVTGVYFFVLTEGKEYGVYVSSEGYLFEDFKFEFAQNTVVAPDTLDVFLQPLRVGASLVLENIYFEKESYELSPKSISELEEIAAFLRANKMRVEISGHTDDTGGDDYNQRLSERRAEAVYLYLVRNGINPVYLQKIGYGSTRPRYLEEVQKPLNRRIEFEIIEVKQ